MTQDEIDLLAISRGTVTAPAGCGKTHLIAKALSRHGDSKRILVLTHTNAGVVAPRRSCTDRTECDYQSRPRCMFLDVPVCCVESLPNTVQIRFAVRCTCCLIGLGPVRARNHSRLEGGRHQGC
jgi:hypothetical protein